MSPRTDAGGCGARVAAARRLLTAAGAALFLAAALAGCATSSTTGGARERRPGSDAADAGARVGAHGSAHGDAHGSGRRFVAVGRASYYAHRFDGRPTASGERYDPARMTAAHASLPFGTWLRVTRDDGRFVEVRVNDRCGCGGGHVVDLSWAAARRLDMVRAGTAHVRVEVIER